MIFWPEMTLLARELIAAALVGAGFLALFALAELWRRFGDPPVEWTRKLVHFFGGLLAAAFPWIFLSRWTVVGLAALFTLLIWGTRRFGLLSSVHGVERKSQGGIYFPLAVLALFLMGHDRPVLYLVSILALVVSDTFAALVGTTYGRQGFSVETDRRSLEGSAVFFLATFLITHLPLLLMARLDPLVSVLIAVQVAILVTQFEAISLRGNDNLIVPLVTFFLLIKLTPYGADHMAAQLLAQLGIIAVVGLVAWRLRPLTFSGAIAFMLYYYGAWSLGGPEWVVAPTLALLAFMVALSLFERDVIPPPPGRYQVVAAFYVCIVSATLYIANNALETLIPGVPPELRLGNPLYAPFVGAAAAQIAVLLIAQFEPFRADAGARPRRVLASAGAAYLLVAPAGLAVGPAGLTAAGLLLAAAAVVVAIVAYLLIRRVPAWPHQPPWNVRLQALSVAVAAAVVVPLALWRL